jgi:SAM-dependent methyltransferase
VWDDPDLYELENADDPAFDVGFWSSLIRERSPRRVLELACGTGRLTLPLARLGVAEEIVALDTSAPFLERLRSRLAQEPPATPVSLVESDMRAPAVEGPFDLIAVPFNSLAYLIGREDRVAAVRAARELLAPDGRFAFDLVAPFYDYLAEATKPCPPVRVDVDHAAPDHGVTRFVRSYTDVYDAATQTLRSTNRYEVFHADGRVDHRIADLDWHIYFPDELELLLSGAGLAVTERFGDYERGAWTATSRRYLWVTAAR